MGVHIVGAGLGGWRTAAALRRLGYDESIILLGAEPTFPYDRPPLSKRVLQGLSEPADTALTDEAEIERLRVDFRPGSHVERVDAQRLKLANGSTEQWDQLVIATGARTIRPGFVPDSPRVVELRTVDDAVRLRQLAQASASALVVGGGFIGTEVAASLRGLGLDVSVFEAREQLVQDAAGPQVGELVTALHRERGVHVVSGSPVASLMATADGVEATTGDGRSATADFALIGLGVRPNVDLLDGLGLDLSDGVPCDARGRVRDLPRAWAVGDVAQWTTADGSSMRREHWTSANDQAEIVAHAIADAPMPAHLPALPYVWSDQYDTKVQLLGRPDLATSQRWIETSEGQGAYGHFAGEHLVGVVTCGPPRLLAVNRAAVMSGVDAVIQSAIQA